MVLCMSKKIRVSGPLPAEPFIQLYRLHYNSIMLSLSDDVRNLEESKFKTKLREWLIETPFYSLQSFVLGRLKYNFNSVAISNCK